MADKKRSKNSEMQYGKDIESLQDKVDSYMDPKTPDKKDSKSNGQQQPGDQASNATGPPLLPSDKIPKSVASSSKDNDSTSQDKPKAPQAAKTEPVQSHAYDDWPEPETNRKNLNLEDGATGKAVDEIVAAESDQLLENQDKNLAEKQQAQEQPSKSQKKRFYKNKKFYKWLFIVLFAAALAAMAVPASRYFILNTLGVRASTSVVVVDEKTGQPLKNAEVSLGGQSSMTGIDGEARIYDIKLGKQDMIISKPAFAESKQETTIGWGSNPLGEMGLKPVGAQYSFLVTDYLSGLPIDKVEASSGEADALSNQEGKITLVVEETGVEKLDVTLHADGYRDETITVSPDNQEPRDVVLVPSRKHAFVSKRNGTYDVYKTDIDGKNEKLVLAGMGTENEDELTLVNHPTDEVVAFVSVRGEERNNSGQMLGTLQVIDLNTNESKSVVSANRIQVIDWVGERLVYVKEQSDRKPSDPNLHKLMSYDYKSGVETELASANYFNDVSIAQGVVYYSPSGGDKKTGLYAINADSSGKKSITKKEVWNIFRTDYYNLRVSLGQQWYDYNLGDGSFTKAGGPPSVLKSRIYYDSPDRTRSIWSEDRDGKGVLVVYDHNENKDEVVLSKSGLRNPLRWLTDSVVIFRVDNGQETADYAMSLDGGEAKKITDVTNVTGIDKWYFY